MSEHGWIWTLADDGRFQVLAVLAIVALSGFVMWEAYQDHIRRH